MAQEPVTLKTSEGTYQIAPDDLEQFRVADDQVATGGDFGDLDFSALQPQSELHVKLGQKPILMHRGTIVVSAETAVATR